MTSLENHTGKNASDAVDVSKPNLIVVAVGIRPNSGSEPGKGYQWTCALSRYYTIHLVSPAKEIRACEKEVEALEWHLHPTHNVHLGGGGLRAYIDYYNWCKGLLSYLKQLVAVVNPCGLHHVTLGSFRVLPRYDLLGIPYTLGPIGGGEVTPWKYLRGAGIPLIRPFFVEAIRPALNYAFCLAPPLRKVVSNASLVLGTTAETEHVLRVLGAKKTAAVFPDAVHRIISPNEVKARRSQQVEALASEFRMIWSARFLWWKGGQIAIEFLYRLRRRKIPASLVIYSTKTGIERLKGQAHRLGIQGSVRCYEFVPRKQLLQALLDAHLYVYPTLHDSSSSSIPEAYMTGLPTMTLGVGGVAIAACPQAGLNRQAVSISAWLEQGSELVAHWQRQPSAWLKASHAALAHFDNFLPEKLQQVVGQHLSCIFHKVQAQ